MAQPFIPFIENQEPLHVSSITCLSSGGHAQTVFSIWRANNVRLQSWHNQLTLYARSIPNAVCEAPPEDEQVILEIYRGSCFSIN
jgi:hypothetical protein